MGEHAAMLAAHYATRPEQRIAELRNDGVHRAIAHLVAGQPGAALAGLRASVEQQALLAGCGHVRLP